MTVTGISVAFTFDLMTVTSYSLIQLVVSMTVPWHHHISEYELHAFTKLWHVAILMTVTGISVAHTFDFTTATNYSMIQLTCRWQSHGLIMCSNTNCTQSQGFGTYALRF